MAVKYRAITTFGYVEFHTEQEAMAVSQDVVSVEYEDTMMVELIGVLNRHLDELRWQKEQGGITIGGISILTRDRDKLLINGKISYANQNSQLDTDTFTFTHDGGDFTMTIGQLRAIGNAIVEHVQRTIDAASQVRPLIANGTLASEADVAAAYEAAYQSLMPEEE